MRGPAIRLPFSFGKQEFAERCEADGMVAMKPAVPLRKAVLIAFLIAVLGPPVGGAVISLLDAIHFRDGTLAINFVFTGLLRLSYVIGGAPALIAGVVIAWRVYRTGPVSWRFFFGLVLVLSVITAILTWLALVVFLGLSPSFPEVTRALLGWLLIIMAAVFASAVFLRLLIVNLVLKDETR